MAENKLNTIVVSQGSKSISYKINSKVFSKLYGYKIGDIFNSSDIIENLNQQLKITGGSTSTGTPLCSSLITPIYKKIRYKQNKSKGIQKKLMVYGNQITEAVVTINTIVCS